MADDGLEIENFWQSLPSLSYANEAEVEQRFVLPLLRALGYADQEISPKARIVFQEGRRGRPHEADFIVHTGSTLNQDSALLVVEAKKPGEDLADGKRQAESYAHASRAPFLLLTDGESLELWQMQISQASQRVLFSDVRSLSQYRGRIECLIGCGAARQHSLSLGCRNLTDLTFDVSAYARAELNRLGEKAILSRRLMSDTGEVISNAKSLLDGESNNLLITAGSGDGKTMLAEELHRYALAKLTDDAPIPVLISLTELADENITAIEYARHRVAAHSAQFKTAASFADLVKKRGAVLFCDGLDRVSEQSQRAFLASCSALVRDFPKLKVIIFGRVVVPSGIGLQHLEIQALSREEKWTLASILGIRSMAVHQIPQALDSLTESPLLLTLILRHMEATGQPPNNLSDIFHSWLDRLLEAGSTSVARRSRLRSLLARIATLINGASAPREEVSERLDASASLDSQLDDLVRSGALIWDRQVEICHDALGEFLRAENFLSHDEMYVVSRLQEIEFQPRSLLPIFLLSMCRTWCVRQAIWSRLSEARLPTYLDALRFDQSSNTIPGSPDNSYFQDFRDGIVQPIKRFFPQVEVATYSALAWSHSPQLGVRGELSADGRNFGYEFFPAGEAGEPIASMHWNQQSGAGGFATNAGGLPVSPRKMGFNKTVYGLEAVLKARQLKGGAYWSNERLIGRIHFMNEDLGRTESTSASLKGLKERLHKDRDLLIGLGRFGQRSFTIASMIEDIENLESHGWDRLDPWWEHYPIERDSDPAHEEEAGLIGEFWRRSQIVYREVIDANFLVVSEDMNYYCGMPMRYRVEMYPGKMSPRSMSYLYKPVETWEEAGADVGFEGHGAINWEDDHYQESMALMAKFGRVGCTSMSFSQGPAPVFDGSRRFAGFDGETAALREAISMLCSDLNRLFERAPVNTLNKRDITNF